MSLLYPPSLVVPFGRDAIAPYIRVVPVPSQEGITPGAASWRTGYVPANMTLLSAGGIPPAGADTNGALNYISAHSAWVAAGGYYTYNVDYVTENTGYPIGAVLRSAANPLLCFYNTVADNAFDPDADLTGWIPFPLIGAGGNSVQTEVLPAGATNDLTVATGTGAIDLNPTSGAANVTGFTAGYNGQQIIVTNIHASNPTTINMLNGGSSAPNQVRLPADITLLQYSNLTLKYFASLSLWIPV